MIQEVRDAVRRAGPALWRDLVGMAMLGAAFVTLLHLASFLSA